MLFSHRDGSLFRTGSVVFAAALIAGCSGGGSSSLPQTTGGIVGTSAIAVSPLRSTASEGANGGHDTHSVAASVASLTFASPSANAQTITFTNTGNGEDAPHLDVDLSATGIVTIARVECGDVHHDNGHHYGNDGGDEGRGSCDRGTVTYSVTPVAAGTVNIVASRGKSDTMTIPVTVGSGKPPITVAVGSATIDCSTMTCGTSGIAPIGGFVAKVLLPTDTLAIASSINSASFVVTSTDGNCGIVGATSPATIAATPPSTIVTVGLTSTAYQTAEASGGTVATVPCAFTVTDTSGNTATASLSYILPIPL